MILNVSITTIIVLLVLSGCGGGGGSSNLQNEVPIANNDTLVGVENMSITYDILSNDIDSDGSIDNTSVVIVISPTHGTTIDNNGVIIYTPQTNFRGVDSFTYTVKDNSGEVSNVAEVNISIDMDTDADGIGNTIDTDDDNDNITDINETANGTDSLQSDSDGDGISDSVEGLLDTDNDGIIDALESSSLDTDNDGVNDNLDDNNTNPNNDSDNDGVDNITETNNGTNPLDASAGGLPSHCLMNSSNYSGYLPTWKEIENNNIGNVENPNSSAYGSSDVVGVPDLDNMGDEIYAADSLKNAINLLSNILTTKFEPTVAHLVDQGQVGIGICADRNDTVTSDGIDSTAILPVTFCEFSAECNGDRVIWIPQSADLFSKLKFNVAGQEVDLFAIMQDVQNIPNLPPQKITITSNPDRIKILLDGVDEDLVEASKKWSKTAVEFLDWIFGRTGSSLISQNFSLFKEKVGKFQEKLADFEKAINAYGEGYHLGAFDETRPKLHTCVGYYGHGVYSKLGGILDNKISLGSRYTSFEVSKDYRAQARLGGMALTAFGKSITIMPTPEVNMQIDGISAFDCATPFGLPFKDKMGFDLCPRSVSFSPTEICSATPNDEYVAIPGTGNTTNNAGFKFINDYYPIDLDDNNGVVWPRFDPNAPIIELLYAENRALLGDIPSHAVIFGGLNWAYESEIKEPRPRVIKTIPIAGPLVAQLKYDLEWGIKWYADSYFFRDRLKDALDKSAADIDADEIFERPMHVMQAEDLTSENGNGYYVNPSFIISAGLAFNIPKKKPKIFVNIGVDLGLYAGVDLGFSSGIADTGIAVQTSLQHSSSDPDLPCEEIVEATVIQSTCNGNLLDYNNPAIQRANEIESLSKDNTLTQTELDRITNTGTLEVAHYGCSGVEPYKVELFDDHGELLVDEDTNKTVTTLIDVIPCEDRGSCVIIDGNRTTTFEGLTKSECSSYDKEGVDTVYTSYSCNNIQRYEATGWEGPGCSPLVNESGYPSAPGGSCDNGSCDSGYTCSYGACVTECSTSDDCASGETCNQYSVCELSSGLDYAEQMAWKALHPDFTKPLHSVWTHAISEAKAFINFGAGLNLKARLKFWKIDKIIVDKRWDKYWELVAGAMLKYQSGLQADYTNECNVMGKVTNHQPIDGDDNSVRRVWRVNPDANPHEIEVFSGVTTTDEFIQMCEDDIRSRIEDPDANISSDALVSSLDELQTFSEDLANDIWNEYNQSMCVNGVPWDQFLQGMSAAAENGQSIFGLSASDGFNATLNSNFHFEIAKQSGCLDVNHYTGTGLETYVNSLPQSGNRVNIVAMMLDPDGDFVESNIKYTYRSFSKLLKFNHWYDETKTCIENYIDSTDFNITNFNVGPCDTGKEDKDRDGIPDTKDNCPYIPNGDQVDSDNDGVGDVCDNCPSIANSEQQDSDDNGVGDICENNDPEPNDPVVVNPAGTISIKDWIRGESIDGIPGGDIGVVLDNDNVVIDSSVSLKGGYINLNGNQLTVNGDLYVEDGTLIIDNGELIVNGNLLVERKEVGPDGTLAAQGTIIMSNATDKIYVQKDFIINSSISSEEYLTHGVLRIDGDFEQRVSSSKESAKNNFKVSDDLEVILSGTEEQIVKFAETGEDISHFGKLTLHDSFSVRFTTSIVVSSNFDHQGNEFILEQSSKFIDSDMDGITDEADNYPLDPKRF